MIQDKILLIFSDGSKQENFESLCAVSILPEHHENLLNELQKILKENKVKELKFSEITTHNPKIDAAKAFVEVAINFAALQKIRIDVIIWNLQDKRHAIPGRDDKENLERMYFRLLRNIVER